MYGTGSSSPTRPRRLPPATGHAPSACPKRIALGRLRSYGAIDCLHRDKSMALVASSTVPSHARRYARPRGSMNRENPPQRRCITSIEEAKIAIAGGADAFRMGCNAPMPSGHPRNSMGRCATRGSVTTTLRASWHYRRAVRARSRHAARRWRRVEPERLRIPSILPLRVADGGFSAAGTLTGPNGSGSSSAASI